jgi:hypothetical protein
MKNADLFRESGPENSKHIVYNGYTTPCHELAVGAQVGVYPIVASQYSSTTLCQGFYHTQSLFL